MIRTYHIGVRGVSNSEFGNYLNDIKLNQEPVEFDQLDLSYLSLDRWDDVYLNSVRTSPLVTTQTFASTQSNQVRIEYTSLSDDFDPTSFVAIAKWAGVMDNIKAGVPRTAYKGIVTFYKNNIKVHVTPSTFI